MLARHDPLDTTRRIYGALSRIGSPSLPRLRIWTGEELGPTGSPSTIVLRHPGALRALLVPPSDLTAGEAYIYDDVELEGDIAHTLRFAGDLDARRSGIDVVRLLALAASLPRMAHRHDHGRPSRPGRRHSLRRDSEVVGHHYDTGNRFFESFLGQSMVYSCAHFLDPAGDLDTAQFRKLDLVCRKLALRPGDRFLDVGCGWGSLAIHAASKYGVNAVGVTLSGEQASYARRAAAEAGVQDSVEILQRDYRELEGRFDAIASVGMFEHVGRGKLAEYFGALRQHLAPGGIILNHGIIDRFGSTQRQRRKSFVGTYVFPDGDLLPVGAVVSEAEAVGFEVRDLETLRMSYANTLRHWVANLEVNRAAAVAASSERTYRIWRLYMAGSQVAFERAAIGVDQLLLADPVRPWTYGRAGLLSSDDRESIEWSSPR